MELYATMAAATFVSSIIQSTVGFSGGLMGVLILSTRIPVLTSSGIMGIPVLFTSASLAWRFRKEIRIKLLMPLVIPFAVSMYAALQIALRVDVTLIKAYFGLGIAALALYTKFLSGRLRLKTTLLTSIVCAVLAGGLNAFFSLGGPIMALYILSACKEDKDAYIANSQMALVISNVISIAIRIHSGVLTADLLPLALPAVCGLLIGQFIGIRVLKRLNMDAMKTAMFAVLIFTGLWTFFSNMP